MLRSTYVLPSVSVYEDGHEAAVQGLTSIPSRVPHASGPDAAVSFLAHVASTSAPSIAHPARCAANAEAEGETMCVSDAACVVLREAPDTGHVLQAVLRRPHAAETDTDATAKAVHRLSRSRSYEDALDVAHWDATSDTDAGAGGSDLVKPMLLSSALSSAMYADDSTATDSQDGCLSVPRRVRPNVVVDACGRRSLLLDASHDDASTVAQHMPLGDSAS